MLISVVVLFLDTPTQLPPLTPGTNKKLILYTTEVLKASNELWAKEVQQKCDMTKGKLLRCYVLNVHLIYLL